MPHSNMPYLNLRDVLYRVPKGENLDLGSFRNDVHIVNRLPEDVLVRVCSQWRRICINNPLLWACVHIESFPLSRFTNECISRAKNVHISLNINPPNHKQESTIDIWTHLLRTLATRGAHAERWKSLILRVSDYRVFPNLLEYLNSHSAPNLEVISCTQLSGSYAEPHPDRRIASSATSLGPLLPNLRSLELKKVHIAHLFGRRPPVTLTSLTCLNLEQAGLDHYTPNALAHLLSASPHLEELSMMEYVDFEHEGLNSWTINVPVAFSSLHRLKLLVIDPYTVVGSGLRWITRFLRSIDAPKLQQLVIISPTKYTIINTLVENLVDFISTGYVPNRMVVSEAQPRKLLYPELRYFGIFFPLPKGAEQYMSEPLLAALPSLTHLGILGEDVAVVDITSQCSPGLVYLSVQNLAQRGPELGDALRRRQEAGFPIRVVALQCDENTSGLPSTVELKSYDRSQVFEFLDL